MTALLAPPSARVALNAYRRIAEGWGLHPEQGATLLGVSPRTIYRWSKEDRRDSIRADTLERISHLVAIWENLAALFGRTDLARTWVARKNADFGDRPPLQRMLHGNVQDLVFVRTYLERARQGW
jgi:uncharacterized protein (DUF2384 family)